MICALNLPVALGVKGQDFTLRRASQNDLGALMFLLSDDTISAGKGDKADDSDTDAYRAALKEIVEDPSNDLLVVVDEEDEPLATMQLTRIPGMARLYRCGNQKGTGKCNAGSRIRNKKR